MVIVDQDTNTTPHTALKVGQFFRYTTPTYNNAYWLLAEGTDQTPLNTKNKSKYVLNLTSFEVIRFDTLFPYTQPEYVQIFDSTNVQLDIAWPVTVLKGEDAIKNGNFVIVSYKPYIVGTYGNTSTTSNTDSNTSSTDDKTENKTDQYINTGLFGVDGEIVKINAEMLDGASSTFAVGFSSDAITLRFK